MSENRGIIINGRETLNEIEQHCTCMCRQQDFNRVLAKLVMWGLTGYSMLDLYPSLRRRVHPDTKEETVEIEIGASYRNPTTEGRFFINAIMSVDGSWSTHS